MDKMYILFIIILLATQNDLSVSSFYISPKFSSSPSKSKQMASITDSTKSFEATTTNGYFIKSSEFNELQENSLTDSTSKIIKLKDVAYGWGNG